MWVLESFRNFVAASGFISGDGSVPRSDHEQENSAVRLSISQGNIDFVFLIRMLGSRIHILYKGCSRKLERARFSRAGARTACVGGKVDVVIYVAFLIMGMGEKFSPGKAVSGTLVRDTT